VQCVAARGMWAVCNSWQCFLGMALSVCPATQDASATSSSSEASRQPSDGEPSSSSGDASSSAADDPPKTGELHVD
jgi:hypothetical protein